MELPTVVQYGLIDIQVCVPKDWTDKQIIEYANLEVPSGTIEGWHIRREGDSALAGDSERMPCAALSRRGFIHIMLDC